MQHLHTLLHFSRRISTLLHGKIPTLLTRWFGCLQWTPPSWLRDFGARSRALAGKYWTRGVTGFLLLAGLWGIMIWSQHLPKPPTVTAGLIRPVPPASDVQEPATPSTLTVYFPESVARLESMGKNIFRGISLKPILLGTWEWKNDRTLVFQPKQDWPADQDFKVEMEAGLFRSGVKLTSSSVKFRTDPFNVSEVEHQFYIEPQHPEIKRVTATLRFNYPVDPKSLAERLRLKGTKQDSLIPWVFPSDLEITYSPNHQFAYLKSKPLALPEKETFLRVLIAKGIQIAQGSAVTADPLEVSVNIPDRYSLVNITGAEVNIVMNSQGVPEQILMVHTSTGIKPEELSKHLNVAVLPVDLPWHKAKVTYEKGEERWADVSANPNHPWAVGDIDDYVKRLAGKLTLTPIPSEAEFPTDFSFRIQAPEQRSLYVEIQRGLPALGGFILRNNYTAVCGTPRFPRCLSIQESGSLLAWSGEHTIGIVAEGIDEVEWRIARVCPQDINHLVSQSEGDFQNPSFNNYHFDDNNLSEVFTDKMGTGATSPGQRRYLACDLGKYINRSAAAQDGVRGLFLLRVAAMQTTDGKDEYLHPRAGDSSLSGNDDKPLVGDRRLILITDLGFVTKTSLNNQLDVFVQSIHNGLPVSGAVVEVLGKNGVPVASGETDREGRATLPSVKDLKDEKEPIAFVVRKGADLSFMPFGRNDRLMNFSRFDVGGESVPDAKALSAFIFSDRGIYRPGDPMHFGVVLRSYDWKETAEGLPAEWEIVNPRGQAIHTETLKIPATGFCDLSFSTTEASPTGEYILNAYLSKKEHRDTLLGSETVTVREFLPDSMRIKAVIVGEKRPGWYSPDNLAIQVNLNNLHGLPAPDHQVDGRITLHPAEYRFGRYPDFDFFDPQSPEINSAKERTIVQDLAGIKTDETGTAVLPLDLARIPAGAYWLDYLARGYESIGGRSVSTGDSVLVSSRPWLMGSKADGDLSYIAAKSQRTLELLAVDPTLAPVSVPNLSLELIEVRMVSILAKKDDGNFAYQSIRKEIPIKTEPFSLTENGFSLPLVTLNPGDYLIRLRDEKGVCVFERPYTVAGEGVLVHPLEKNAELRVKIDKSEYAPGEEISVAITAPYQGAGLMTIERDQVYAHAWFKTEQTSSVQKIRIPRDFEGNGYLNIAYIRAQDSPEIQVSPLSYAVVPFRVNREARTVHVALDVVELSKPGEPLQVGYRCSRKTKLVVFAVDEGILQVAGYQTPQPLDHFMATRALEVQTSQILDLILPEYSLVRQLSAFGGDAGEDLLAANLNPFKRKTEPPVVAWSGIIDADEKGGIWKVEVPDYFHGSLRIMAVAVAPEAMGSAEAKVVVRGAFILEPSAPLFVTPGDEFEAGLTVTNAQSEGQGESGVQVNLVPSPGLTVVAAESSAFEVAPGKEKTIRYRLKALNFLGEANLQFILTSGQESCTRTIHLSLRPALPYRTQVCSGSEARTKFSVPVPTGLYPEFRKANVSAAPIPLGFAQGLTAYLQAYPYCCTEQLTSKALATLALSDTPSFGMSKGEALNYVDRIMQGLRSRQNDQGAFGLWSLQEGLKFDFPSIYLMHFLTDAVEMGYAVSGNMKERGLDHLREMARDNATNLCECRRQSYAIYILTRNGEITTPYLEKLALALESGKVTGWKKDITSVYLGASYELLRNHSAATEFLQGYRLGRSGPCWDDAFGSPLGQDAQYVYLLCLHFPEKAKGLTEGDLNRLVQPIIEQRFNTLSAAYSILALRQYAQLFSSYTPEGINLAAISAKGTVAPLALASTVWPQAEVPPTATGIEFERGQNDMGKIYYQIVSSGFAQELPKQEVRSGLEVYQEWTIGQNPLSTSAGSISLRLGEEATVTLRLRALNGRSNSNIAALDLLPAGVEVLPESMEEIRANPLVDYVDLREDRLVIYGTVGTEPLSVTYKVRAVQAGDFVVPPLQAESMYERGLEARGLAGRLTIQDKP